MPYRINLQKLAMLLPSLYFIAFFLWTYIGNRLEGREATIISFLLVIPFVVQLIIRKKTLSLILGILTLLLSIYLVLAYLSDLTKINDYGSAQALKFIVAGAAILIINFIMSILFLVRPGMPVADKTAV